MISSDSTRQEMSMLPKGVKKLLEPFISLTCGMLKIAVDNQTAILLNISTVG